jgi:hypothetical protein
MWISASCLLPVLIRVSVASSISFVIVCCSLGFGGADVRTCLGSRSVFFLPFGCSFIVRVVFLVF